MGKGMDTNINEINGTIQENRGSKKRVIIKIVASLIVVLIIIALGALAYINYMLGLITYVDSVDVKSSKQVDIIGEAKGKLPDKPIQKEDETIVDNVDTAEDETIVDTNEDVDNIELEVVGEVKIYNFLICGVEAIGGGRGRTDSILLGTLDAENKSIKLTSLMRDINVKIDGHKDNKLNASYSLGGMPLLVDTVQKNFGVKIEGYVVVNFDGFKDIIDALGGVEIKLTKREADYLNRTNYIADKRYRTVVEGMQTLNGEQALGYSRVRYVKASNGQSNDFGRTYRQRTVLQSIFNKYKDKNILELMGILPDILKLLTTDLTKKDIINYATLVLKMGIDDIEMNRIPSDKLYENKKINNRSVLQIKDWEALREELNIFIYGDNKG